MTPEIERIARVLTRGGTNVVFTGAGISTESGIPDYRSQGGIWDKFQPVYFDDFMSSEAARIEYWRQKTLMYHDLVNARPNPAHNAIAILVEQKLIAAVVTQNIDGLHQASGVPSAQVIELHGNTRRIRCMTCGEISSEKAAQKRVAAGELAPDCHCGGFLKPDTISFGQAMPQKEVEQANRLAAQCDFFMVVGSTLVVHPAAMLPEYARRHGAFLTIVNLSATPYDGVCDVRIEGKAGQILPAVVTAAEQIGRKK